MNVCLSDFSFRGQLKTETVFATINGFLSPFGMDSQLRMNGEDGGDKDG